MRKDNTMMTTEVGIRFTLVYDTSDQVLACEAADQLGQKLGAAIFRTAGDSTTQPRRFRYEGVDESGIATHHVDPLP